MTTDDRVQALAAALGQDVSVLQAAIIAIAGGPLPVGVNNFPADYPLPAAQQQAVMDTADRLLSILNRTPALDAGRVPVSISGGTIDVSASYQSLVSVANSRDTNFAANEVWWGEWEDVRDYAGVTVYVNTSHNSAAPGGAMVQFSDDISGANPVTKGTFIPGGVPLGYAFRPTARYIRFGYTNGSDPTTYFRSEVSYHFNPPALPELPLAYAHTDVDSGISTKAHVAARHASGQWVSLAADENGRLQVALDAPSRVTTKVNGRATGTLRAANPNANAAQVDTPGATRTVVVLEVPDGHSSSAVEISAASPLSQVVFEQSDTGADGTWAATNMRRNNTPDVNESFSQIENNPFGTNNVQLWKGTVGGIKFFRVRCNALAPADATNGITVTLETSEGVGGTYLLGNPPSFSDYFGTGTLAAPGDTVECRTSGQGSFAALFSGQWTGSILVESTIDGSTWRPINVLQPSATGGTFLNSVTGLGTPGQILQVRGGCGGLRAVRLRANTDYAPTSPATGTLRAGAGSSGMYLMAPAPIAGLDSAQTTQVTVGTTAVRIDSGAMAARSAVEVKYRAAGAANGGKVYVGFSNAVTATTGRELDPGEPWALDLRASVQLWAIASAAGQVVCVTELG